MFRYAQYGDVSPKIDVYAFGVVLYELISAKEAVVKTNEIVTESKGLVALVVFFFSLLFSAPATILYNTFPKLFLNNTGTLLLGCAV